MKEINKLWGNALKGKLQNKDLIQHEQDSFFKDCPQEKEHIILFVLCWNNGFKYKSVVFERVKNERKNRARDN